MVGREDGENKQRIKVESKDASPRRPPASGPGMPLDSCFSPLLGIKENSNMNHGRHPPPDPSSKPMRGKTVPPWKSP